MFFCFVFFKSATVKGIQWPQSHQTNSTFCDAHQFCDSNSNTHQPFVLFTVKNDWKEPVQWFPVCNHSAATHRWLHVRFWEQLRDWILRGGWRDFWAAFQRKGEASQEQHIYRSQGRYCILDKGHKRGRYADQYFSAVFLYGKSGFSCCALPFFLSVCLQ